MASRVNTKLILILTVSLFGAGGVIGGLWFLQMRGDASRAARIGDEFFAQGELEKAKDYYQRAVGRAPGNLEYLQKLEDAILLFQPSTTDEAALWYKTWLTVLRQRAVNFPEDGVSQLRFLTELYHVSRRSNLPGYWQRLEDEAREMLVRMSQSDPHRPHAEILSNTARIRRGQSTLTLEELSEAEGKLIHAVNMIPHEDFAWAALLVSQNSISNRIKQSGQQLAGEEKTKELLENIEKAGQAVPEGLDTTRAILLSLGMLSGQESNITESLEERITAEIDRLVLLTQSEAATPDVMLDSVNLLTAFPGEDGLAKALDILDSYLERNPDVLDLRMVKAKMHYNRKELEASSAEADAVLHTRNLPVSYLAIFQNYYQREATSLIGNIEFARWEAAPEGEKASRVEAMRAARQTFEGIVPEPEADPMVMKLDGLIAYATGDYQTAVSMFEKLIQGQGGVEPQTLVLDAKSLEKIGQLGRAHQRVEDALQLLPGNTFLSLDKARLEFLIGRFDEARETISDVLRIDPENANALALLDMFDASKESRQAGGDVRLTSIMRSVDDALARGDTDVGRSVLLNALGNNPDNLALIEKLIAVESGAGDLEAANRYLSRGLEIAPRNARLLQIKATLTTDNPVEALERFAELAYENELDRAVVLLYNFNAMSIRQDGLAQRHENDGDSEAEKSARDIAVKARQAAGKYQRTVAQIDADHPALIDYLYTLAISEKDWEAAELQIHRAQALNLDHAQGAVYQGRYELSRGQFRKAMQTLQQATRLVHYSSSVWKTFALACEGAGDYSEARRAYGEAYECNPTDLDVARRYAKMLERVGDKTRALGILRDTYNLAPNNIALREAWLSLEEEVGSLSEVLLARQRHYKQNTRDYVNTAKLAEFYGYATPSRILLFDENGEEIYSATNWNQRTAIEQQQILALNEEGWRDYSNRLLDDLEENYPDPFSIVSLRARIFRKSGQVEEGNQVFQTYLEQLDPKDVTLGMRMTYASFLMDIDRSVESIAELKEAIAQQDPLRREVDATIAETYFQLRQYDRAIFHFERLREVSDNREILLRLIDCFVNANQFEKADESLARLSEAGETEFTLSLVRATIAHKRGERLHREGNLDAAQQEFRNARALLATAESLHQTNPEPHLRLAQNYLAEFQLTRNQDILIRALAAVDRAERLNPVGSMADELRSDLLSARGDVAGAINELIDVLRGNAANTRARQKLIQLRIQANNGEEAIRLTREGIRLDPNSQRWHILLGDLMYSFRGDVDGAIQQYTEAYSIRQEAAALAKLINSMLVKVPADYQEIERLISAESEATRAHPDIQTLYARALHGLERPQEALDWMQTSYETYQLAFASDELPVEGIATWLSHLLYLFPADRPDEIESLTLELCGNKPNVHELRGLSKIYLRLSDSFDAYRTHIIELQRRAIEECPVGAIDLLATLYNEQAATFIQAELYGDAAEAYERVLELTPNNVFVMNNYAYLLADYLGRPEDALAFAKTAVERNPQNIDLLDTLGWVYFKLGEYQLAARNLELGLSTRESLSSYLHLAEVLIKLGDLDGATERLRMTERFPLDEQTRAEIDRLNDDIQLTRRQGGG